MKIKLLEILIVFTALSFAPLIAKAQRTCGYCMGKGMIQTRFATSNFGVAPATKTKCKYCGEMVMEHENHWDACTHCKGSGKLGTSKNSSRSDENINTYNYKDYLTYDEAMAVYYIEEQLRTPYHQYTPCPTCNATGRCSKCGGTGGHYEIGDHDFYCILCGGSGLCITCRGTGSSNHIITENPNKNLLLEQLAGYIRLASERANKKR